MVSGRAEGAERNIEEMTELIAELQRENDALKKSLLLAVNRSPGDYD